MNKKFCINCRFSKKSKCLIYGELRNKVKKHIDLLILGEAPGATEEKLNKVFVGKSGRLLRYVLQQNLNPEITYFITNCLECRPTNNQTPNLLDLKNCKHKLLNKINLFRPKIILTLGKTALYNILKVEILSFTKIILNNQYSIVKIEDKNIIIVPNFHPAYLLYSKNQHMETFILKIKIINKLLLKF